MISFEESIRLIEQMQIEPLSWQRVPLQDALGRVVAQDIRADEDSPQAPTAAMDGYGVRYEDLKLGPLKIAGTNPAGAKSVPKLMPKECIKTFTGSLMPNGSDTLVPIEMVEVQGDKILIKQDLPKGFSVRVKGEHYTKGQLLIPKGSLIDFAQIGVMSSVGVANVNVYLKPTLSVLSTGSELLEIAQVRTRESQIRSSNNYTLAAIAKKYGEDVLQKGVVKDEIDSIKKTILEYVE